MVEARVEFDYVANEEDELTLNVGEVITDVVKVSEGWCEGTLNGKRGLFPDNFVKEVKKEKPAEAVQANKRKPVAGVGVSELRKQIGSVIAPTPPPPVSGGKKGSKKAKVLHEYESKNVDELTLEVGQIIEILKQEEEGWWEGNLNGKIGMFPSNFVEVVESDEAEKHAGGEDVPVQEIRGRRVQGVGFGNIFTGGPINLRPTEGGKAPAAFDRKPAAVTSDANLDKPAVVPEHMRGPPKAKVPTPTGAVSAPQPPAPVVEAKPLRAIARYPYDAVNDDELSLAEGDIVVVLDQNLVDAGWWRGELRGRVGVFPDNFVELLPPEEKPHRPPVPAAIQSNGAVSGPKTGSTTDASKIKKEGAKEPLVRQSSIPLVDAPQPPKKVAPKVPDVRPTIETDDHKAKNKEVWRSDTLDRAVMPEKTLKPLTADRTKAPGRRPPTSTAAAVRDATPSDTDIKKDEKPVQPSTLNLQPIKEESAARKDAAAAAVPMLSPARAKAENPLTGQSGDLAELQVEVQKLRSDLEQMKRSHERRLADLTSELDDEKKTRLNLQVEIERLKKRLAD
jgi:hypothetical protein